LKRIYVVGTADTKGEELAYLAARIEAAGGCPLVVDVGTRTPAVRAGIGAAEILRHGLWAQQSHRVRKCVILSI
jgi:uncharacterized protein (UPF0261 family)